MPEHLGRHPVFVKSVSRTEYSSIGPKRAKGAKDCPQQDQQQATFDARVIVSLVSEAAGPKFIIHLTCNRMGQLVAV